MMLAQLLRTKTIEPHITGLKRCLSVSDLTFLGIGAIIGTGIFVLTGLAAAHQAGPAVILSFIFAGTACAFAALSYAEMATMVGGCGSAYGYSYVAFGELVAWTIGWVLLMEYGMSVAAVANGWSGYFNNALSAIGIPLPNYLTKAPSLGGVINLPAALIILGLMLMLIVGAKESARLNAVMVLIKILVIALFVGIASAHVNPANWHPFMPFGWFSTLANGKTVGIFAGASIVFFAYVGFDAVSTAVEESINPERDIPKAIFYSLTFCTVIYVIVSGLLTGIVPYQDLGVSFPVAHALQRIGFSGVAALVSTGVIAGLTTVMLVLYYGLTRIIFAMSRDGLLPPWLNVVHSRTQTPVRVIVLCGLITATIAGFIPLGELAELVNIGTLAAFVLVCCGVIMMRYRAPHLHRPYKTPYSPIVPMLGALSCGTLMAFLPAHTWQRFLIWLSIGLVVYFIYGFRHSILKNKPHTPPVTPD